MLSLMREYATSWLIKIILGAIVIVFVFWGVGSFRNRKISFIASVNDDNITLEEFNSTYNALLEQMRQRFGKNLNEDMVKMLRLNQQALDQLIDNRLMLQEAARLKLRVTKQEIVDTIMGFQAFQNNGQFDQRLYQRVLEFNRLTPEIFEKMQADNLLTNKLRAYVLSNVHVSDGEALTYYQWQNASVDIDYVLFIPEKYPDIEMTDEEIGAFFEKSKALYKTDPMVNVQYIHFNPDNYKKKVGVSDAEIEEYYNNNRQSFEVPKTVEARHILIKVAADASEEDVALARARAVKVLDMVKAGQPFEELAKQYSEGPSSKNGGQLGAFKKEDMVAPFAEKAFSMKAGEVSEPVRTRFGWHLIKVEKVNEASSKTLAEAKATIFDKLVGEKAKNMAYDAAEAFYDRTLEGDNIADMTQGTDLKVVTTGLFSRQEGPSKGVTDRSRFSTTAFGLKVNQISEIQDFEDGYYLLQVIEAVAAKIPKLESVKDKVTEDLKKEKQLARAEKEASALLDALKNDPEGKMAVQADFKSTGFFKRNASIPEVGYENEVSNAAFMLSAEKPLPQKVFKGSKGFYVIRFNNRELPDSAEFDKEKEKLKESLLARKQMKVFDAWLAQIKDNSEIVIKEGFIE